MESTSTSRKAPASKRVLASAATAIFFLCLAVPAARAQSPSAKHAEVESKLSASADELDRQVRARVDELIAKLGSANFQEREEAERDLEALGDELLWNPNLDAPDLERELGRFDRCFMAPLDVARQSSDREVRTRSENVFSRYCPGRRIGPGIGAWALYGVWRLWPEPAPALTDAEEYERRLRLAEKALEEVEFMEQRAHDLERDVAKLTVAAMGQHDPHGTAEWLAGEDFLFVNRGPCYGALVDSWSRRDFDAALAWALAEFRGIEIPGPRVSDRYNAYAALLRNWDERRPIGPAVELADGPAADGDIRMVFLRCWAAQDPEGAFAWAAAYKWEDSRAGVVGDALRCIVEFGEVELATRLQQSLPPGETRDIAAVVLISALRTWPGEIDASVIDSIGSERWRDAAIRGKVCRLAALGQVEDAIAAAQTIKIDSRRGMAAEIAAAIGKTDPMKALKWLEVCGWPHAHTIGKSRLAMVWAESDPRTAAEFVECIERDNTRSYAALLVARRLVCVDAPAAFALLERHGSDLNRSTNLVWLIKELAAHNHAAALRWADGSADTTLYPAYCAAASEEAIASDAKDTVSWTLRLMPQPRRFALAGLAQGAINLEK